ncbi:MAG: asparaginase [Acidobacteriota bacterium]
MSSTNPTPVILAEVTRGAIVESRHRGAIVAVTPHDQTVCAIGNIDFVTYLRSSAKPHQTIAVITSGAAARFQITAQELALMAGSHSGEPYHAECAANILAKLGLDRTALRCGIHTPFSTTAAAELGVEGVTELHNNCSGKHAGMLAEALIGKHSLDDYYHIEHPVQQSIRGIVGEFAGIDRSTVVVGIDGCSAATFAVTVRQMALMYARLVNPSTLASALATAAGKVVEAMLQFPEMVAAETGRIDTDLMRELPGQLIAKAGAEGVYTIGVLPCSRYPEGLGLAIKVEDGDINRARNAAILGSLAQLQLLNNEQMARLSARYLPPIKNHRGLTVGEIRPVFSLR